MKNYKRIRLFEQAVMNQAEFAEPTQVSQDQHMQAMNQEPQPVQLEGPAQPLALPTQDQSTSEIDVMSMTVRDLISKCKQIDPLVCMGIETFLENNKDKFKEETSNEPTGDENLKFSSIVSQEAPAHAEKFSLDQSPEELNFPG